MHIWPEPDIQALQDPQRVKRFYRATGLAGSLVFWCAIAAAWGGILAWRYRNFMNPDGISYLDIASNTLRMGPAALVNPHWSPLYPALIAFWEWLHQPLPFGEFAYIHALNAVIYTLAAISFAYFLRQLIRFRSSTGRSMTREVVFVAFGFALFFRFMNIDVTAFVVTPDLLVAAAAFVSAGLFFRLLCGAGSQSAASRLFETHDTGVDWRAFAALGVTLALGYLAKSVMLPAGIVLLVILLLRSRHSRAQRKGVWIAAGVMFLLSTPQIVLVSKRVGHLSFSATGRLNYLWWVDGMQRYQGWTGTPGGDKPTHGPRILQANPKIIEFGSPIPGTYPLWYNPAYWYAGAKVRIDLRDQIQVIENTLRFYRSAFSSLRLPLEGLVVLAILAYAGRRRISRTELLFLLWPVAVLSMYALLITEYRYAAPFLLIFWMTAYSAVLTRTGKVERMLLAVLAAVILLSSVWETFSPYRKIIVPGTTYAPFTYVWIPDSSKVSPDQIAARKLASLGLRVGDPIATVGSGSQHYYAHIDRVQIMAEVVNAAKFWNLQPPTAVSAEQKLAAAGAKVLVAKSRPKEFQAGLWQGIPGTDYSVLMLRH